MIVTLGNHPAMNEDLDRLQATYESLGVEVRRSQRVTTTDAVFHRDVAAWFPWGEMLRPQMMGKESRRHEVAEWMEEFHPLVKYTLKQGTFEGADLLWLNSRHCVLANGQRTNEVGAKELAYFLEFLDFNVTRVTLPEWHEQHLLGILNVVRGARIFVDDKAVPQVPEEGWLADAVQVPHYEYAQKHTNFVQVDGSVVINAGAKVTIGKLEHWCDVVPVEIPSLLAHGGGVACATGIIQDQIPMPGEEDAEEKD